ncbi:hypothetical protein [Bacillus massiliglaciei]|uniref:hypothetical protein n=1 Tax=Bacillus massiliglaciei TaxID=1816693 RepID=UPI000DA60BE7|nr:hypothetical protein [Bacillus massiliglaciei]
MNKKKMQVIKYVVLVFSLFLCYQAVEAHDKGFPNGLYISSKGDVTGDKKTDMIQLKGKTEGEGRTYKKLSLIIESNRQSVTVPLEGGLHPSIQMADFNHDKVSDVVILFKSKQDKEPSVKYVYSFLNGKPEKIELPSSVAVMAQFKDHYMAEISGPEIETAMFDMSARKEQYEKLGLYQKGILNEPAELIVSPPSKVKIKRFWGRGKGLAFEQVIEGISKKDKIACITSSWIFKDGKWKMLKAEVHPYQVK